MKREAILGSPHRGLYHRASVVTSVSKFFGSSFPQRA